MASAPRDIVLDGGSLTREALEAIASGAAAASLAPAARRRMQEARAVVEEALARGDAVYGLTTGVAERKTVRLDPERLPAWNRLLVASHRVAEGPPASPATVRATIACLANNLVRGTAGVRPELVEMLLAELAEGFTPEVRTLGSVGESDLGPMADLADGLLRHSGFELAGNEGLALVNSNAFSTAGAALALGDAVRLLDSCDAAAALDLEAFGANLDSLHEIAATARPYPGLATARRRLVALLEGNALSALGPGPGPGAGHVRGPGGGRNLQDPLTFRCVAQVHGAARDALGYVAGVVATELNASQGNPLVVVGERRIVSVGSFESLPVAAAMDFARIALAPVLTSAAERTVKLLQRPHSGLPAGLAEAPDTGEDALAELALTAQALAVEARSLAHPVSYDLASTSKADGIEDRTTMAPLSARRLAEMAAIGCRIVAVELTVAAQALDLRTRQAPDRRVGRGTQAVHQLVRAHVTFTRRGEPPPADLEPLVEAVRSGALVRILPADAIS